ncbi:hypothetical protein ACLOJK_018850 [Asimina triloba]
MAASASSSVGFFFQSDGKISDAHEKIKATEIQRLDLGNNEPMASHLKFGSCMKSNVRSYGHNGRNALSSPIDIPL